MIGLEKMRVKLMVKQLIDLIVEFVYSDIVLEGEKKEFTKKNIIFLNNYLLIIYLILY